MVCKHWMGIKSIFDKHFDQDLQCQSAMIQQIQISTFFSWLLFIVCPGAWVLVCTGAFDGLIIFTSQHCHFLSVISSLGKDYKFGQCWKWLMHYLHTKSLVLCFVVPKNVHTPSPWKGFWFEPPTPPARIPSLVSYFPFKILDFETPHPSPAKN